ncbi:hypothetical protein AB0C90_20170 [Streptomyces sp. NPDC048550]|uniref:hypothetical protein n=1 Tax=Streptomyces sp. NPDC048550 TaxID=3155739 RepID=UPI003442A808
MFAIEVESQEASGDMTGSLTEAVGRIVIGDFVETFRVPLGFWSESDYRRSWRQAFDALKDGLNSRSCLLVSMTDPENSNFLTCWPMYRDGENVYIQNAIIFLGELELGFDTGEPWASIGPRCTIDEDGNKISEWETSMDSVRNFFG